MTYRIELSVDANAGALYLRLKDAPVVRTVGYNDNSVHLDLAEGGEVVGIEVVGIAADAGNWSTFSVRAAPAPIALDELEDSLSPQMATPLSRGSVGDTEGSAVADDALFEEALQSIGPAVLPAR